MGVDSFHSTVHSQVYLLSVNLILVNEEERVSRIQHSVDIDDKNDRGKQ